MAVKLQTIADIRKYLSSELAGLYPEGEIWAFTAIITASVLKLSRLTLHGAENKFVEPKDALRIVGICEELKSEKPIQYILGETVFLDCVIRVRPGVLIPRPETEELADLIIRENPGFTGELLDIGTGSGCIAVAVAVKLPSATVSATDVSDLALGTASENAALNNVKINFIKADILKGEPGLPRETDILVSNPPYVRNSEKEQMRRNVLNYEPHEALFVPDSDPLLFYRAILAKAISILRDGGRIYFEINEALGSGVRELTASFGFSNILVRKDINGKDRIVKATWNG